MAEGHHLFETRSAALSKAIQEATKRADDARDYLNRLTREFESL